MRSTVRVCGLTRKCSRQAGVGQRSWRAQHSLRPNSGSVDWCGRQHDRLQLICHPLDSGETVRYGRAALGPLRCPGRAAEAE